MSTSSDYTNVSVMTVSSVEIQHLLADVVFLSVDFRVLQIFLQVTYNYQIL